MKIFSAIGLGIGIIVLKLLAGQLFTSFDGMLITLFDTINLLLTDVQSHIGSF